MKILHLISSGGMYGAEAVILNLAHVLQRQGDTCAIASFGNASRQLHERASAEGLTSQLVPCHGQFSPGTVQALREMADRQGADVLHAHGYKADLYAWAALRGRDVALVSTCHTWYDNDLALRMYGVLDRLVLKRFDRVVAVSAEVERQLLSAGVAAESVRRIRNGIDLAPFAAVAAARVDTTGRKLRVGLVGRLSREKGVDVFLSAAAIVAGQIKDVEFVVIGEGPDRAELEQRIRELNMGSRFRLSGHQTSMLPVYAGLDLLVSASRQEGLPIALLEGMASGLPLVGTTAGEVPTLITPEKTGLLVEPGNAEALAAAMLEVLGDAGKRLSWGKAARCRIEEEFSADRMVAEYREVYCEAMRKRGHGA